MWNLLGRRLPDGSSASLYSGNDEKIRKEKETPVLPGPHTCVHGHVVELYKCSEIQGLVVRAFQLLIN